MRKIIAGFFISLDGVVEAPETWHMSYFNEEMGEVIGANMAQSDANLFGRVNYLAQAEHWTAQSPDDPFAKQLNGIKKYVVSDTLDSADWANSTLIKGADAAAELAALKEQEGGTIYAFGSATLVRWLINEGLLDELQLLVHPVVVGHGQRLFAEGDEFAFETAEVRTFKTGVVYASYQPKA
jgi:dihydrofolate reductase